MKGQKYTGMVLLTTLCISQVAFAGDSATAIQAHYILKSKKQENAYDVSLVYAPSSPADIKTKIDGVEYPDIKQTYNADVLTLSNFRKISAKITIDKLQTTFTDSGNLSVLDSTSAPITLRDVENTYFLGDYRYDASTGDKIIVLPIQSDIDYTTFLPKKYTLEINGQNYPLEYDLSAIQDGKYYIKKDQIRFLSRNIDAQVLNIKLKIDGMYSNSVLVKNDTLNIGSVNSIDVSEGSSLREARIHLSNDARLANLNNKEIYVNNVLIDKNNITLASGEIIVKVDISKKIDDVLVIQMKDTLEKIYSNKVYVNMTKYTVPNISQIDFGSTGTSQWKLSGTALVGDLFNYEINLNGTGYTKAGNKVEVKKADGSVSKDIDGNIQYTTINQVNLGKDGDSFTFSFPKKDLLGVNTLFLYNKTYEKKSNIIEFTSDGKITNYNTGASRENAPSLMYTKGTDVSKKIPFITAPEGNFKLGSLSFSGLDAGKYYTVGLVLSSDVNISAFKDVKYIDSDFSLQKTSSGIQYVYTKMGYGKDFQNGDIIFNLNDVFNIEKQVHFSLSSLSIGELQKDSTFKNVFIDTGAKKINLSYHYNITGCYDGAGDYCDALNLGGDASLQLDLTFGDSVQTITKQNSTSTSTSSSGTTPSVITSEKPILDSEKIAKKAKFSKQMILSKNKLLKSKSTLGYVAQVDALVAKISAKKGQGILDKIAKIDTTKLGNKKDLFDYIEAKIWMTLNK